MGQHTTGGVERSLRELNLRENDRVPLAGGYVTKASFLEKVSGMGPFWSDPRRIAIEAYHRLGVDMIVQFVLPKKESDSTESTHATNFSKPAVQRIYTSPEEVVEDIHNLPSPSQVRKAYDIDAAYTEYLRTVRDGQRDMGDMFWISYHGGGSCAFMWYSKYGFRPYFLAMMKYPDEVEGLFRYSAELGRLKNIASSRAMRREGLPRFVYLGEDICYNRGPMVPVQLLREIYFPNLKRALHPLKGSGVKIIWHSDGNILPILDDLLDCGIDGFQGFQAETDRRLEELAAMKARSGNRLILWGSVSVSSTLPFGSVGDVRRDVERCIDAAGKESGFFLSPSSSVGPEVPDRNILAMYRHGIDYGTKARS